MPSTFVSSCYTMTERPIAVRLAPVLFLFVFVAIATAAILDNSCAFAQQDSKTADATAVDQDTVPSVDTDANGQEIDFEEAPHLNNTQSLVIEDKWKRLGKNQIWINHTDKQVMVRGRICLQEGALEMFACPGRSKAHESVIAVEAKSSEIHQCFLALGVNPGKPVQWDPDYTPVQGPSVKILVRWQQGDDYHEVNARQMVKISGTNKTLEKDWVFGGSQIYVDNVSGEKIYYADSGEMVCLSNFSTAMLDVPMQSSDAADGLLFEANQENIPPPNTQVYMIFAPDTTPRQPVEKPQDAAEGSAGK